MKDWLLRNQNKKLRNRLNFNYMNHSDPKIFGLSVSFVKRARKRYLLQQVNETLKFLKEWRLTDDDRVQRERRRLQRLIASKQKSIKNLSEIWAIEKDNYPESSFLMGVSMIEDIENDIKKLERDLYFLDHKEEILSRKGSFDIQYLKTIPIDNFVEVNRAGFFKIRDEKTPSVKYYRDRNTWHDFGTGENGDVIDLIMKLKGYNFQEACNFLLGK